MVLDRLVKLAFESNYLDAEEGEWITPRLRPWLTLIGENAGPLDELVVFVTVDMEEFIGCSRDEVQKLITQDVTDPAMLVQYVTCLENYLS